MARSPEQPRLMRFGISIPPHGDYADVRRLMEMAREAEAAGWDGFFLWDHMLFMEGYDGPIIDPWIALAAIAVSTSSVRIGTLVTPLARRRPWKVARETATLDRLSGGRLILGVGLGYPRDSEFEHFGEEGDERVRARKLDESLAILAGLWSGRPFEHSGEMYRIQRTRFLPTPVQQPRIPVWVGGYWPNRAPFRRAARWDGFFPGRLTLERRANWTPTMIRTDDLEQMVAYVRRHRPPGRHLDVAIGGYTDDASGPARRLTGEYAAVGATWWIENLHGFRGPLPAMRQRIRLGPARP